MGPAGGRDEAVVACVPQRFDSACGVSVIARGCLTGQRCLECLPFTSEFLKWPVFFFLQTILGPRLTSMGKNTNMIAASKSTQTYMPWMGSIVLTLLTPKLEERVFAVLFWRKAKRGSAGPCGPSLRWTLLRFMPARTSRVITGSPFPQPGSLASLQTSSNAILSLCSCSMYASVEVGMSRSFLLPFSSASGSLEKWADGNLTHFQKNKCRVLWLGRNSSMNQDMLGASSRESSFPEEEPGGPGGHNIEGELAMCPCGQEV